MRRLLSGLIILFALLAGTMHAPAIAHADVGAGQSLSAHVGLLDHHSDHADEPVAPADTSGDATHHHHCPAGLSVAEIAVASPAIERRVERFAVLTGALASRQTAPPTQPPSA